MSARENPNVLEHGVLRFLTAGSVDDGKSTLIGRLLYDTGVLADQLAAVARTSEQRGQALDLSLLTDGLTAEREQGITIDVAYRCLPPPRCASSSSPTRRATEQYTRNMVTAASTAHLAVLLVDARHGIVTQTRRHATLAHLLGIPHLVVAVNKMDLVDYREETTRASSRISARLQSAPGSAMPRCVSSRPR
jgi:sulfate adenylyltransferase subunit 1